MEDEPWAVEFYVDRRGRKVVEEFIDDLPPAEQAQIAHELLLLRDFGLNAESTGARHVSGRIWELRPGGNRLFYFAHTGRRLIILHGYRKKGQKAPKREIAIAERRLVEVLRRG